MAARRVVSFGGGVNGSAMLLALVEAGEPIDAVLFADTGGEKPETYAHVAWMSAWLVARGLPAIVPVREPRWTLEQECLDGRRLPSIAYGFRSCSDKFKRRPIRRWLRETGWDQVEMCIGMDAAEGHRASDSDVQWITNRYPLIERGWDREDCARALRRAGLPVPIKSACFFCPSSKRREVTWLRDQHPVLYARALVMERGADLESLKGLGRHWSWATMEDGPEQMELPCECLDG